MKELTSGIVIDSYKLLDYKKELIARGFNNFTIHGWDNADLITIKVKCTQDRIPELREMCDLLEIFFKSRQN